MWISKLKYLADIFSCLYNINISLHGYCINIFTVRNQTNAFKKVVKKRYENVSRN